MSTDNMVNPGYFSSDEPHAEVPAYVLIAHRDINAFQAAVSKKMLEEYRPLGGVYVAMSNNAPVFCQSLVLSTYA